VKWDATFLQSKVARRIFFLFVLCALVPITVLTLISYRQVTRQLKDQARKELRHLAEVEGMAIFEKLEILDDETVMLAENVRSGAASRLALSTQGAGTRLRGSGIVTSQGNVTVLTGSLSGAPVLTPAEAQHLSSGKALLQTFACENEQTCVRLLRQIDTQNPGRGFLVVEPDPKYLWDTDRVSSSSNLCILTESGRTLSCPTDARSSLAREELGKSFSGDLEWAQADRHYLGGYWKLFLKPNFLSPQWTVILSESAADVLSPLTVFQRTFPLVILLTVWVVLLLSVIQIRRSLVPLKKLQKGTRQVANSEFDARVEIASGDEFEELAASFNQMATRLGRQFRALQTIDEIDRGMLSSLHSEEIVRTVLRRTPDLLSYQEVCVGLADDADNPARMVTYVGTPTGGSDAGSHNVTLPGRELEEIQSHPDGLQLDGSRASRSYLAPLVERGMHSFLVLPLFHDDQLLGILSLGNPVRVVVADEDRRYARQIADQLAAALANARLVKELDRLSVGTLTALARAIDAKSTWTAGHSERVTSMAVEIGKFMGLPERELSILYRGGLLHDIGKIGTPPAILEKPEKLTAEEFRIMREHVATGARILEPIPGFAELIPIVLHHHERFDGSGYPDGLAGEAIHLNARIFAVADVYDAMISDRPYRKAWPPNHVVGLVCEKAGTHFDPRVVQAFLEVVTRQNVIGQEAAAAHGRSVRHAPSLVTSPEATEESRGAHVGS